MLRRHLPSTAPLTVAAGLSVLAMIFTWPEPLAGGWLPASLVMAVLGAAASLPFWQAAQAAEMARGKTGLRGIAAMILAGMIVAVAGLHLANLARPGLPVAEAVVTVTDKFTTRGRRGRTRHHVRTTPVPGETGASTRHSLSGLGSSSGSFDDYQVGGCMAVRWRQGWWWRVVASRQPITCPAMRTDPASPAKLPLAQPGQAWPLVQQRLADGLAGLDLPPAGLRVDLVVNLGTNGLITATHATVAGTAAPLAVTALITAATDRVPFALSGAPGRYRLWLKLKPADKGAELGRI